MKAIIENGYYLLKQQEMNFNREVEIHVCRFGKNTTPLFTQNVGPVENYKINFKFIIKLNKKITNFI